MMTRPLRRAASDAAPVEGWTRTPTTQRNDPLTPVAPVTHRAALRLQRSVGNRALLQLLPTTSVPVVQRVLGYNIVSASGGAVLYQEADGGAKQIATLPQGSGCNVEEEQVGSAEAWSLVEPLVLNTPSGGYVLSSVLTPQPEPVKDVGTVYARAGGQLYDQSGEPQARDAKQGAISNCFLIASFAAVAMTPKGRVHIKAAIVENVGAQNFSVRLYDIDEEDRIVPAAPIVVDRWFPADAGRFIYCPAEHDVGPAPLWAAVLEKAFAADAEDENEVGYAALDQMGNAATNLALLTGRTVYTMVAPEEGGVLKWRNAYEDEDTSDEIANFDESELLVRIRLAKESGNRALLAESRTPSADRGPMVPAEKIVAPEKTVDPDEETDGSDEESSAAEVEDTHVYVITGVIDDRIHLWDPRHGPEQTLSAGDFKKAFDRIVMVDMDDSPAGQ